MNTAKAILEVNLKLLEKQLSWLEHSFQVAKNISIKDNYNAQELDAFEALSARFSRMIDFLVRRIFRTLDEFEFEPQGTLIDVVNNAHKRGLFNSVDEIRQLKDLRNQISHKYIETELIALFDTLLEQTPRLIHITNNTLDYSKKLQ